MNTDGTLSTRLASRVEKDWIFIRHIWLQLLFVSGGFGKEKQFEGTAMKKYLVGKGVPAEHILVDNAGSNTLLTAKNFMVMASQNNFSSVIVVSQFYHITRTKYMLRAHGGAEGLLRSGPLL